MTKRRLGPNHYFFWRNQVTTFGDIKATLQFLSAFKDDPSSMGGIRRLLVESRRRIDVSRLTDDQAVAEIASLIATGELVVASDRQWDLGGSTGNASAPASAPAATGDPIPAGSRTAEPESPTFPPSLNGAAQAATLSAAAASGAPFCPH